MKKIIVIGCPGSGKSTFSKALCEATGIPLYHLDMLYWNADKTTVDREIFLERLSAVLAKDEWIIDGNYASTMEQRMQVCDTVIWLDYPTEVCLDGVKQRRGKPRSDMPWTETEEDVELLELIKDFRNEKRPQIIDLLRRHADQHIVIFKNRAEADAFLNRWKMI